MVSVPCDPILPIADLLADTSDSSKSVTVDLSPMEKILAANMIPLLLALSIVFIVNEASFENSIFLSTLYCIPPSTSK